MIPAPAPNNLQLLTEGSTGALKNNSVYIWDLTQELVIFTLLSFYFYGKNRKLFTWGLLLVAMGEMQQERI